MNEKIPLYMRPMDDAERARWLRDSIKTDIDLLSKYMKEVSEVGLTPTWAIYQNPPEHPGRFIARLLASQQQTKIYINSPGLLSIQESMLKLGLTRQPRGDSDDAALLETWVSH